MFRKPAKPSATTAASPAVTDSARVLSELLARPSLDGVLESVLAHAAELVGGNTRAYATVRPGQDRVVAVLGYDRELLGLAVGGPWSAGKARVITDGAAELFATNPPEVRARLDLLGMREVRSSMVVPLRDRYRFLGAIVLDRYEGPVFTSVQLDAVSRWAASVTPLVGLLEGREEARQLARRLTEVFVESVESLDFDNVGHSRQVTQVAVKLGRAVGLNDRDIDELWYAAMLHDLGKLHGDEGHAQVGANLLHDVPQLTNAQLAVRHHHERWDGFGEPDRLVGEEIPPLARIVAIADAYVRTGSVQGVAGQAGQRFDPRLLSALERMTEQELA